MVIANESTATGDKTDDIFGCTLPMLCSQGFSDMRCVRKPSEYGGIYVLGYLLILVGGSSTRSGAYELSFGIGYWVCEAHLFMKRRAGPHSLPPMDAGAVERMTGGE